MWDPLNGPVPETTLSDPSAATSNGYSASKYVVEQVGHTQAHVLFLQSDVLPTSADNRGCIEPWSPSNCSEDRPSLRLQSNRGVGYDRVVPHHGEVERGIGIFPHLERGASPLFHKLQILPLHSIARCVGSPRHHRASVHRVDSVIDSVVATDQLGASMAYVVGCGSSRDHAGTGEDVSYYSDGGLGREVGGFIVQRAATAIKQHGEFHASLPTVSIHVSIIARVDATRHL